MLAPTHRAFSTTVTSATLFISPVTMFTQSNPLMMLQVCVTFIAAWLSSTWPDVDRHFGRHRGITHAIWAPLILFYFYWHYRLTTVIVAPLLFGFFLGYISHIIGDAFSTAGDAILYPFQKYKYYPNGAFHVRGNRFIFIPLYKVGESSVFLDALGIKATTFWYIVTMALTAYCMYLL